jgi:hypothetical protein
MSYDEFFVVPHFLLLRARVVGSVFKLGEYGGGLDVKLEILCVRAEATSLGGKSHLLTRSFWFLLSSVLKRLEKGKC